jgi:hypothetical protein
MISALDTCNVCDALIVNANEYGYCPEHLTEMMVGAVLAQVEDLSLEVQLEVLAGALTTITGHVLSYLEDMRQEVSPID